MIRCYISGPITDDPDYLDRFRAATSHIAANYGVLPLNPAAPTWHKGATDTTWAGFMRRDIALLLKCQMLYLLTGWKASKGATLEFTIAKHLGMPVVMEGRNEKQDWEDALKSLGIETISEVR